MAADHGDDDDAARRAKATLKEIFSDEDLNPDSRARAASLFLDRTEGRPAQAQQTGTASRAALLSELPDSELDALIMAEIGDESFPPKYRMLLASLMVALHAKPGADQATAGAINTACEALLAEAAATGARVKQGGDKKSKKSSSRDTTLIAPPTLAQIGITRETGKGGGEKAGSMSAAATCLPSEKSPSRDTTPTQKRP